MTITQMSHISKGTLSDYNQFCIKYFFSATGTLLDFCDSAILGRLIFLNECFSVASQNVQSHRQLLHSSDS